MFILSKKFPLLLTIISTALLLFNLSCSRQELETIHTAPSEDGTDKSFFVDLQLNGNKILRNNKTFLCGWAPITEIGYWGEREVTHNVNKPTHCNLKFEISEKNLIGKQINPSFPDDPTKWKTVITIPINEHYYYEQKKDEYGRDTNEFEENSSRSHWSRRPKMKLDFSGLSIKDWAFDLFHDSHYEVISVEDIEWDNNKNFLGFTLNVSSKWLGADKQAKYRFNFMQMAPTGPNFKITRYHPDNAHYFNILHLLGKKINGIDRIFYAGHWDTTKKHKIHLNDFPKEFVDIGISVINSWNDVFEKIGNGRPFIPVIGKKKNYYFDLRVSSINWIGDKRISIHSPLGIGQTGANILTGEIVWGAANIYGGMLEEYLKKFTPSSAESSNNAQFAGLNFLGKIDDNYFNFNNLIEYPLSLENQAENRSDLAATLSLSLQLKLPNFSDEKLNSKDSNNIENIASFLSSEILNAHSKNILKMRELRNQLYKINRNAITGLGDDIDNSSANMLLGKNWKTLPKAERDQLIREKLRAEYKSSSSSMFDQDITFANVAPEWGVATEKLKDKFSYQKAVRAVIKETMMHEMGHVLGLGHNFKENILPDEGTVPKKYFTTLKKDALNEFSNTTTVMGYKHAVIELNEKEEHIAPGPHDRLVLEYLYNQKYATFDKNKDNDFKMVDMPKNGKVPCSVEGNSNQKTTYFPACNDLEASLMYNPYCNRFDRGYNAQTIVNSYFEDLNSMKYSKLFAFTDAKGKSSSRYMTYYLWSRNLRSMGRVRLFYDYMRSKYKNEIDEILNSGDGDREKNAYEFSRVCSGDKKIENGPMTNLFNKNPNLKELCQVNKTAVEGFANFMSMTGSDYNIIDHDNYTATASITAGDTTPSSKTRNGTWEELSDRPFKYSALNALTTTSPYIYWNGFLYPISRYAGDGLQTKFTYASLYPSEYTRAISEGVEKNLSIKTDKSSINKIKRLAMDIGGFIRKSSWTNDNYNISKDIIEDVEDQSQFSIDYVAVMLTAVKRKNSNQVTHFTPTILNLQTQKETSASRAYLLDDGSVIVQSAGNFIYPLTKIKFLSDDKAYIIAIRASYDEEYDSNLTGQSVKNKLHTLHSSALDACIAGRGNGLSSFFNMQNPAEVFPGFTVIPGIANDEKDGEKMLKFKTSLKDNYKLYENLVRYENRPDRKTCQDALQSIGLIVNSAALLNGYWLPGLRNVIIK